MARFDDLPDKIILKIFSYLSKTEITYSTRKVCTRWKKVSEDDKIWMDWSFCPGAKTTEKEITTILKDMPLLRQFIFYGTFNLMKNLAEYCRKIRLLWVPHIKLSADLLNLIMERLPELTDLRISISPTHEGLEMTRIIARSRTLVSLQLRSSGEKTVIGGLLIPIANGCPNLIQLRCENFNCPDSEICYLMHRKRSQLVVYCHYGVVSAAVIKAMNECPNLKRIAFTGVSFDEPFHEISHITQLQNLKVLEVLNCRFPMLKLIPLTLFLDTLSHLSYIRICHVFGNVDFLINKILLKCPLLTHLDLERNNELTCRGLRNISSCKMLRHLDVPHCKNLDQKAIEYVAEGCPMMEQLDVSGIPMSEGLFRQILKCRILKTLMMTYCDVSVINLDLISTNIPGLMYLYIGPRFKFGHDCIRDIKQHMPRLNIKSLSFVNDINDYATLKKEFVQQYIKDKFVSSAFIK